MLFRASYSGDLMTDGDGMITEKQLEKIQEYRSKTKPLTDNQREELNKLLLKQANPELSQTTIKRLIIVWAEHKHNRTEDVTNKYMEKGTNVEEDSITLYSLFRKKYFKKNEDRISNSLFTGLPDLFSDADSIHDAEEITDIKSSWSLITFLNAKFDKKINHNYKWQGNTYLSLLTKSKRFRLAYCLVNSTAKLILDEKFKLQRMMGFFDPTMAEQDATYIELCKKIERNHIFDLGLFLKQNPFFDLHTPQSDWSFDIPAKDRVFEMMWEKDKHEIDRLYSRAKICKNWIDVNLKMTQK
jgi:hypothetical protein